MLDKFLNIFINPCNRHNSPVRYHYPIFKKCKPRHRKVKSVALGHTATECRVLASLPGIWLQSGLSSPKVGFSKGHSLVYMRHAAHRPRVWHACPRSQGPKGSPALQGRMSGSLPRGFWRVSTQRRKMRRGRKMCQVKPFFWKSGYFLLVFLSREYFWVMKTECGRLGPWRQWDSQSLGIFLMAEAVGVSDVE